MLETAFQCFQGASRCECDSDEEEWLIHYMLGKIAEKRKQTPVEYLQLYQKVNDDLFCGLMNRAARLLRPQIKSVKHLFAVFKFFSSCFQSGLDFIVSAVEL